jgi:uncharacterized protein YndB with AHSA1/START domain
MSTTTDRIEKKTVLKAPIARVWRAITDAKEFGSWFGVEFDGPFVPGERLEGKIVPTTVDREVAKTQEPYAGAKFEIWIERVEPIRLFSFHWHPFAVDATVDYSGEPKTRVSFELADESGETALTIVESGFDSIPAHRRAKAFTMNDGGWAAQVALVAKYVERGR